MKGKDIIEELKKKFGVNTDRALASHLGITTQAIQNWKKRPTVTRRQIAGLIRSAHKSGSNALARNAIHPIVEFYPIEKCESQQGNYYEIFGVSDKHPLRMGVQKELREHRGIYIFFDSRGQAIYAGKAKKQHLWSEMKRAFNRDRGEVQKIKRVKYPTNKVKYRTSFDKDRQIIDHVVPLYDLAAYFSAYAVQDGLIDKLEAMLVRSFANDLLNVRMEKFNPKQRRPKRRIK